MNKNTNKIKFNFLFVAIFTILLSFSLVCYAKATSGAKDVYQAFLQHIANNYEKSLGKADKLSVAKGDMVLNIKSASKDLKINSSFDTEKDMYYIKLNNLPVLLDNANGNLYVKSEEEGIVYLSTVPAEYKDYIAGIFKSSNMGVDKETSEVFKVLVSALANNLKDEYFETVKVNSYTNEYALNLNAVQIATLFRDVLKEVKDNKAFINNVVKLSNDYSASGVTGSSVTPEGVIISINEAIDALTDKINSRATGYSLRVSVYGKEAKLDKVSGLGLRIFEGDKEIITFSYKGEEKKTLAKSKEFKVEYHLSYGEDDLTLNATLNEKSIVADIKINATNIKFTLETNAKKAFLKANTITGTLEVTEGTQKATYQAIIATADKKELTKTSKIEVSATKDGVSYPGKFVIESTDKKIITKSSNINMYVQSLDGIECMLTVKANDKKPVIKGTTDVTISYTYNNIETKIVTIKTTDKKSFQSTKGVEIRVDEQFVKSMDMGNGEIYIKIESANKVPLLKTEEYKLSVKLLDQLDMTATIKENLVEAKGSALLNGEKAEFDLSIKDAKTIDFDKLINTKSAISSTKGIKLLQDAIGVAQETAIDTALDLRNQF